MYKNLLKVIHASKNPFEVAWNVSRHGFFTNFNDTKVIVGKQDIFAVVDGKRRLKKFRDNLDLFEKYKPAKQHNSMSFYSISSFLYMNKNFFVELFSTGTASLSEGGFFQRWSKYYWTVKPQMSSYVVFKKMSEERNATSDGRNDRRDAEPTTLEQVRVLFVIYLGMLLVSTTVFLKEFKHTLNILVWDGWRWIGSLVKKCTC